MNGELTAKNLKMECTAHSCYKKEPEILSPYEDRVGISLVTNAQSVFEQTSEIVNTMMTELRISPGAS